jgi:hypothetical protein
MPEGMLAACAAAWASSAQEARGAGMRGVGLGDNRIAGGDRRGEISACDAVEGERKVVGAKYQHWPDASEHRADVVGGVDGGERPRTFARSGRGLPELAGGAGKFDIGQSRRLGERGLRMRHRHEFVFADFDPSGEVLQKLRDSLAGHLPQRVKSRSGRFERIVAIAPRANRILAGERFARGRVFDPEGLRRFRRSPLTSDEDRMHVVVCHVSRGGEREGGWRFNQLCSIVFSSVPMPSTVIWTMSAGCKVNELSGTMPVPVR